MLIDSQDQVNELQLKVKKLKTRKEIETFTIGKNVCGG